MILRPVAGSLSISLAMVFLLMASAFTRAADAPIVEVEGQPLAANVERLIDAMEFLGAPLDADLRKDLRSAVRQRDAGRLQKLIDPRVMFVVSLNPEARVKAVRGPAAARLQQGGYTPVLIKVINDSTSTGSLVVRSPQSGPVYAGVAKLSMERQQQEPLRVNENTEGRTDRFLDLEIFNAPPMTPHLSGLRVEYVVALIYSSEAGKRDATLSFDIGEGAQDLGFRADAPVLFDIAPAVEVELAVRDFDGKPTTGRFLFTDRMGHVFPPQAKRLTPDLFFQKHVYRADGETVVLPAGEITMTYGRGPEYKWIERKVKIPATGKHRLEVRLERWVNPMDFGFYCGDHHIHASGCAHYTSPTEGIPPDHMFRQVKGEALNVGCVLTWGPSFDYQHLFFSPQVDRVSEPLTLLKYDIEVSGFGSAALGHVCLLNLKEQIYPGASGSKNWPTWTAPVLRWVKAQGGITGYAHSGSGLQIEVTNATRRLLAELDANKDNLLDAAEAGKGLLPELFGLTDSNQDQRVDELELLRSHDRVSDQLPHLAIPELNSVGAQEIFVTAALGICDFISAMDTARLREWNCWYHLMNCGLPIKVSGETDFPCMSSTRVGQGRVYVQLGKQTKLDYAAWCEGIARGRSYVSDGYAHALEFTVQGKTAGSEVALAKPGEVSVRAKVAFASQTPLEVAYGGAMPAGGMRLMGDTVQIHPTNGPGVFQGGKRLVELVVNGRTVARKEVAADDRVHDVEFNVKIERSSWVALRQFPQMHTNPVNVLVEDKPIRASRLSARWCVASIEQLWRMRSRNIAPAERAEAEKTHEWAKEFYRKIAAEAQVD